jgi:two-component system cell cycle response regulator DivK
MSKVLIVEDNDLNLKLFYDLLKVKQCEVIISKNGIDVENIVLEEVPDLILMDIQLSKGISGIDLIRDLKRNVATKHIPIIAVTAFAMKTDEERIIESGCDMYLSKPVSIETFFQAIDKFLGYN